MPPPVASRGLAPTNKSGCAYRKSDPLVLVMKTAEHGAALDASDRLNGSPGRCVLTKGQMGASLVVIVDVAGKHMTQGDCRESCV
jgi:hypothetical protein